MLLYIACWSLFVVCGSLDDCSWFSELFFGCCLLFGACCLMFVVCRLLFVGCLWFVVSF